MFKEMSKKKKIAMIVAIIILIPMILVAVMYLSPADVNGVSVDVTRYDDRESGESGLLVIVSVTTSNPPSASGKAELEIEYNDEKVYESKITIKDNSGQKKLTWDKFIVGNGVYIITVSFEGFSDTERFSYDDVVEELNITAWAYPDNFEPVPKGMDLTKNNLGVRVLFLNATTNATVFVSEQAKIDLRIEHEDGSVLFDDYVNVSNGKDADRYESFFEYPKSGNYTISVAYTNYNVVPDSEFHKLESSATFLINKKPVAHIEGDEDVRISEGGVAHFDASKSKDDGEIVLYHWMFEARPNSGEYVYENTTEPTTTYKYETPGEYDVLLVIRDEYDAVSDEPAMFTVKVKV